MLTATLEQIQASPRRRAIYVCAILALLLAILAFKTLRFFEGGLWYGGQTADFGAFHIVAQRIWLGDLDLAYQFASFTKMQMAAAGGTTGVMPWTYPPQFDLLVAPLAFLPGWAAYFLFTTITLAAYLMTLRVVAGRNFALVLVVFFPAIAITIGIGQNGLLTGALIGLVCINAERRPVLSGLALGLMVIKPHLAIAAGIYMLLTRRWPAVLTAAIVVIASSLACTLAFGPQIWLAWLGSIHEAASYLEEGRYQLFRMISAYAALYTAGLPPAGAFWGQVATAVLALVAVAFAIARGPSTRFALGIVAVASVMISPYAYDYDLPIVGIGLALLIPDLAGLASPRQRGAIYALLLLANAYGLLQSARLSAENVAAGGLERSLTPAVGGFALMAVLAMLLWVLRREARPAAVRLHGEPA
ncbi:glycosyltransferase family 87 protein [Bradyrhizobium guangdongense]|uniref:DUF2029 domain-containing protein n=1 Tax=Bradyrhizobium guangdongense TaxID=1325090 RepID=A0A410VE95_9BRAD|nr:glycosyltransferase family 87 protein [Bradyrhizobium guangdongense]QAU41984.1 DUF2029 domain-containing protein [Bradyrhizobium guangdongense]QOZ63043.1 DUF2029 domain-containing protein [Bradyrhizobium guangdongense]GGI31919.1 hypothetical protein GCM10010987_66810 [Bradyrhizobium guangdongense]